MDIWHIWVVSVSYQDLGPILPVDTAAEQVPQSTVLKLFRQGQQQVLGQFDGYGQLRQDLVVQNILWEESQPVAAERADGEREPLCLSE